VRRHVDALERQAHRLGLDHRLAVDLLLHEHEARVVVSRGHEGTLAPLALLGVDGALELLLGLRVLRERRPDELLPDERLPRLRDGRAERHVGAAGLLVGGEAASVVVRDDELHDRAEALAGQGVDELPDLRVALGHLASKPLADLEDRRLERLVAVLLLLGGRDACGYLVRHCECRFVARGDLGGLAQERLPPRIVMGRTIPD
jgi:hypothetical protein